VKKYIDVPVDMIGEPQDEVRTIIDQDQLDELADSIRKIGIIQPLTLKQVGDHYEVVCGHCRLLAAKMVGLTSVPAVIQDPDQKMEDIQKLHENLCRADINPVDEGRYLLKMIDRYSFDRDSLAKMIGRSKSYVDARIALVGYPESLRSALEAGLVDVTVARHLNAIDDDNERNRLMAIAIESGATAATVQRWKIDYEVSKGYRQPEPFTDVGTAATQQEVKFTTACPFCGDTYDLQQMLVIRSCPECYNQIKNIQAGIES